MPQLLQVRALNTPDVSRLLAAGIALLHPYAALLVTCPHPLAGSPPDDPLILRRSGLNHRGLLGARPAGRPSSRNSFFLCDIKGVNPCAPLPPRHHAPTYAVGDLCEWLKAPIMHVPRVAALPSPTVATRCEQAPAGTGRTQLRGAVVRTERSWLYSLLASRRRGSAHVVANLCL